MISKIVILVSSLQNNKFGSQLLIVLREDYTWFNIVIRSDKSKSIFKQIKPNNNKIIILKIKIMILSFIFLPKQVEWMGKPGMKNYYQSPCVLSEIE